MHTNPFLVVALAIGASATPIIARDPVFGPGNDSNCTIVPRGRPDLGDICITRGTLTADLAQEHILYKLHTGFSDLCRRECKRQDRCRSSEFDGISACILYDAPLKQMGFQAASTGSEFDSVECNALAGECVPQTGSFENTVKGDNVIHPWTFVHDDSASTALVISNTKRGTTQPTPFGTSFLRLFKFGSGPDFMFQHTHLKQNFGSNNYTLTYSYNFDSVLSFGEKPAKGYVLEVSTCGQTIDVLNLPLTAVKNQWITRTKQFRNNHCIQGESNEFTQFSWSTAAGTTTEQYGANLNLDNISIINTSHF